MTPAQRALAALLTSVTGVLVVVAPAATPASATSVAERIDLGTIPALRSVVPHRDGFLLLGKPRAGGRSFVVERRTAAGGVDRRFAVNGLLRLPAFGTTPVLAADAQGGLVVAGRLGDGLARAGGLDVVLRLDARGSSAYRFGIQGLARLDLGSPVEDVAVDGRGRILVLRGDGGLVRLLPDGTPDPGFATGTLLDRGLDTAVHASRLVVEGDSALVSGQTTIYGEQITQYQPFLARVGPNGEPQGELRLGGVLVRGIGVPTRTRTGRLFASASFERFGFDGSGRQRAPAGLVSTAAGDASDEGIVSEPYATPVIPGSSASGVLPLADGGAYTVLNARRDRLRGVPQDAVGVLRARPDGTLDIGDGICGVTRLPAGTGTGWWLALGGRPAVLVQRSGGRGATLLRLDQRRTPHRAILLTASDRYLQQLRSERSLVAARPTEAALVRVTLRTPAALRRRNPSLPRVLAADSARVGACEETPEMTLRISLAERRALQRAAKRERRRIRLEVVAQARTARGPLTARRTIGIYDG